MIELVISPLIGAIMALALAITLELWKGRGRRRLFGEWFLAIQPVYYKTNKWHHQKVQFKPTILGIAVQTADTPKKLQWCWYPRLEAQTYLAGPWKSSRVGSTSNGFMTVQISSNGKYMFGYDFGGIAKDKESNFGVLLLGRTHADLQSAWETISTGARQMLPLTETVDFD
jgi:hypothetical protein